MVHIEGFMFYQILVLFQLLIHLSFALLLKCALLAKYLRLVHYHELSVLEDLYLVLSQSLLELLKLLKPFALLCKRFLSKRALKTNLFKSVILVTQLQVLRPLPVLSKRL